MFTASATAAVISQSKPGARAVAIHRRQQDLARAARFGLARPLDGVARGVGRAASRRTRRSRRPRRFASIATMTAWLP